MMSMPTLTDRAHEHRVSRAEFEAFRDEREKRQDGARYELLDGEILMTPSPSVLHQHVLRRLMALVESTPLSHMAILAAPLDLELDVLGRESVLQPDLLVAPFTSPELTFSRPPLLVVEILSPSTWRRDLGVKRDAYAAAGVEYYWVVAPKTPSVMVYRLRDGAYREEAHVVGEQGWTVSAPVEITLCPAELTR